jgi:hypothetical protein
MKTCCGLLLIFLVVGCESYQTEYRERVELEGEWAFALDSADVGIEQEWYLSDLEDEIKLPGTTDSNQKGFLNTDSTTLHLTRTYRYVGPAWYQKTVTIPEDFQNQKVELILERTKVSKLWLDSTLVGRSKILQSPQHYELSELLTPGEHTLTLRIDNRKELTPYGGSHIYSDDTQTNWNGIIGGLYLEAKPKTYIKDLQVYPDIENQKVNIQLETENGLNWENATITLKVMRELDEITDYLSIQTLDTSLAEKLTLTYNLIDETQLWDEYQQPLYYVTAEISNGKITDGKTVPFGMREFSTEGTQFTINGRTTFLRGKHDAAIFPNDGHTPTDEQSWKRMFEVAKEYGINHVRFHSYTPPEAAFYAADKVGLYLQPELPFWGGLDSDSVAAMQREEGFALLKAFANHPSFVMFSHGNELWSGLDRAEANMVALKEYDDRPLYTMGSNNQIGYAPPREVSDFFVGARIPGFSDSTRTHTRMTHAFVDTRDGGILNTKKPNTAFDYSFPISQLNIPVVSHEIGQYQIYPDYKEIDKYTGVLEPRNLEVFRERLKKAGMLDQDSVFQQASGAWSAISYKAEMEAALRTEGMGGFQLLDLQDFSGQGTALVGILDAFMDSKGVVSRETWLQSCNDVVVMARFPKFVWTNDETFEAEIEVANYSNKGFKNTPLAWKVETEDGKIVDEGKFTSDRIEMGGLSSMGAIDLDLSSLSEATRLNVFLDLDGTGYANQYPIWVYPSGTNSEKTEDIVIVQSLSEEVKNTLEGGGKVLLFPSKQTKEGNTVGGLFPPNFWNYEMFKGISEGADSPYSPGTLGLLMDPEHPLFNAFPTDFHTNWQWFYIVKNSTPLILDQTENSYRPTVQVIDNLQRNHKMGLIFEFKVGDGKVLVSMADLSEIEGDPAASQLYEFRGFRTGA